MLEKINHGARRAHGENRFGKKPNLRVLRVLRGSSLEAPRATRTPRCLKRSTTEHAEHTEKIGLGKNQISACSVCSAVHPFKAPRATRGRSPNAEMLEKINHGARRAHGENRFENKTKSPRAPCA